MKFRTLIVVVIALFAFSSTHAMAASVEEMTRVELTHVGELLLGYTYTSLGGGDVDGAVAGASEAILVARMVGDTALERRSENHRMAYRAIALLSTAEAAGQKGYTLADFEIKKLGCRMLDEVATEEWLTPLVQKVKQVCTAVTTSLMEMAARTQMLKVSAALLVDASDIASTNPLRAIGNATAALDIAEAAGRRDLVSLIREVIFSYEVASLMRTAKAFEEEEVNSLAAGRIKALACEMVKKVAPELLPTLGKLRFNCSI